MVFPGHEVVKNRAISKIAQRIVSIALFLYQSDRLLGTLRTIALDFKSGTETGQVLKTGHDLIGSCPVMKQC
jgi:hypothetical protein